MAYKARPLVVPLTAWKQVAAQNCVKETNHQGQSQPQSLGMWQVQWQKSFLTTTCYWLGHDALLRCAALIIFFFCGGRSNSKKHQIKKVENFNEQRISTYMLKGKYICWYIVSALTSYLQHFFSLKHKTFPNKWPFMLTVTGIFLAFTKSHGASLHQRLLKGTSWS